MKIRKLWRKTRELNHEEIWNKYGNMIMKIAHKLSNRYSKPFDELLSEGVLGVFKKLPSWDPDRSSLCTYIYRCANFKMLDYCIKPQREIPMDTYHPGEDNPFIKKDTQPSWIQSLLNELTEEAQHLIKVIFEAPEELYEAIRPSRPKTSQKKLRAYMIDVLDWTSEDVKRAFKEVSQCL